MTAAYDSAREWFWNEDFWLPPNITWVDIDRSSGSGSGIQYAVFGDLLYAFYLAIAVLGVKFLLEKRLFRKVGVAFGLKEGKFTRPATNDVLENAYKNKGTLDYEALDRLSGELGMPVRKIEIWLRKRLRFGKATKLDKFAESLWKATIYGGLYGYSWYVLWDKKWFWSITDCWHHYPHHNMTPDIWWYYMTELAFYGSLMLSQFFDVQRSDFKEMFAHHVATIALMSLSWTCNLFKVGTLVIWVHDLADVFLETAKLCKYVGANNVSDMLFYSFAVSWMVTRLGYFPTWIIYSITVEAPQMLQYFPAYYVFAGLLSVLLILNLFWAYYIFKVAYLAYMKPEGTIERDLRSDVDTEEGERDEQEAEEEASRGE